MEAHMQETRIHQAWLGLRTVLGIIPVVAGLDKFTNLLTHWEQYLSPLAVSVLPVSGAAFMRAAGGIEIAVGLMILTKWTRVGAYIATGWLVAIALNLVASGHYLDVAARDLAVATGAFALARLEEARTKAHVSRHEVEVPTRTLPSVVHG
jgi:uncharacterized membrane protein YphA (DoxX/SURF4 family)